MNNEQTIPRGLEHGREAGDRAETGGGEGVATSRAQNNEIESLSVAAGTFHA